MELHVATVPTRVRGRSMTRHSVAWDPANGLCLVASAGGPPTLWQRALSKVTGSFAAAVGTPDHGAAEVQMRQAYGTARQALMTLRETLLGTGPDVMLLAILFLRGRALVVVGGAGRVYLHQGHAHRRLTAFEDLAGGLVDNPEPWFASTPVGAGDLIVAGSLEAFELPAIGSVAARLSIEPGADVRGLADILLGPAAESGVGAAAAVARL